LGWPRALKSVEIFRVIEPLPFAVSQWDSRKLSELLRGKYLICDQTTGESISVIKPAKSRSFRARNLRGSNMPDVALFVDDADKFNILLDEFLTSLK
jgi:hypothetical protein